MHSVSLDPDEDESEAHSFAMLQTYLSSLGDAEQAEFYDTTLPTIVDYAMKLKTLKPTERSLCYSLQQQCGAVSVSRGFGAALLACGFLSCFPKRTPKTHPTLRDCNFAPFFSRLHK
ncbi:unnamed protein product [Notodromas monacha]|uniref:PARG helical domain-containing protein n=1 Tax=Notodromas monacha TaxID=399045 RepID=A0A7R9BL96_9CRUS|nr:unnamed protein product [Notodromas monacha]CAG0917562.1 unnamed protein product [Notodromas monacha]